MAAANRKREAKQSQRENFVDIKVKTKEVLQDRKKINHLIDLQAYIENEEAPVVVAGIKSLDKIFCHFLQKGYLCAVTGESDSQKQVREWSLERHTEFKERLSSLISSDQVQVQEQALISMMHLLQAEGQNPVVKVEGKKSAFPMAILETLIGQMLNLQTGAAAAVLTRFQEFVEYDDVLFHLLRVLGIILKAKKDVDEKFLLNLICLLEHVTMHDNSSEKEDSKQKLFCLSEAQFHWSYPQAKKFFSIIWQQVLKCRLTVSVYKRVLILLPDKVLPHLERPLLLTDFLMESYSVGGAISVLALHGVFLLMQNYNLEYPEFYAKLYALLDPSVIFVKYRARFFYLLDLFMSSTHVPEYIAAAFIKRLSRLALIAPPNVIVLLLHFIGNLMIRHRGLSRLTHNPLDQNDMEKDPYVMEEANLAACRAVDSSLWEIKSLQMHVLPEVANSAKFIDRDMPKTEWDISQDLELTMEDMLEKETKRKSPDDVPLNFEKPAKFACVKNEKLSQYFVLN